MFSLASWFFGPKKRLDGKIIAVEASIENKHAHVYAWYYLKVLL